MDARFAGLRPGDRVVAAMSGGVDSAVAAALARDAGLDVVGVTLQLYDHGEATARKGACCAGADIRDARDAAAHLDIPHYVLNYEDRFRQQVIDDFADGYLAGETPIPCIRCNQTVKFTDLLATARELDAKALITGHYVRRVIGTDGPELHAAADARRDQSYFLFATTPEQLDYLRFPLGDLADKAATRELAARFGLAIADKPDSQDICFVPQGRYADVIRRLRPQAGEPGDVVDLEGRVLGRHQGIIDFTIGQRRGLGLGGSEPLYVIRLEPELRRVVVGPREALLRDRIQVAPVSWLVDLTPGEPVEATVRIRSTRPPMPARITADSDGGAEVVLGLPEEGVAPGQACVAYAGSRVLGGGWITRTAA
ncbi:MAG: tRNA 2-thiouridine(34) synthase MnmA [Alphaproteobacteria bacterium]